MADARRRNPLDRGGDWFVDTTCIDCDVARQFAPEFIAEDASGLSFFRRPPANENEVLAAWRALLACPTGSIRAPRGQKPPANAFPFPLAPDLQVLGYNARDSFGAHSYLLSTPGANVMVDSPRFVPALVESIEAMGGIQHILLTHEDDVADAHEYQRRFQARVWICEPDAAAAPYADEVFDRETRILPGLEAMPLPGHTRGSAVYLWREQYLFTGDSLAWSRERRDLTAFRDATWYSWAELTRSMQRLLAHRFEWVLPGHGSWGQDSAEGMHARLQRLVARMREAETEMADEW